MKKNASNKKTSDQSSTINKVLNSGAAVGAAIGAASVGTIAGSALLNSEDEAPIADIQPDLSGNAAMAATEVQSYEEVPDECGESIELAEVVIRPQSSEADAAEVIANKNERMQQPKNVKNNTKDDKEDKEDEDENEDEEDENEDEENDDEQEENEDDESDENETNEDNEAGDVYLADEVEAEEEDIYATEPTEDEEISPIVSGEFIDPEDADVETQEMFSFGEIETVYSVDGKSISSVEAIDADGEKMVMYDTDGDGMLDMRVFGDLNVEQDISDWGLSIDDAQLDSAQDYGYAGSGMESDINPDMNIDIIDPTLA